MNIVNDKSISNRQVKIKEFLKRKKYNKRKSESCQKVESENKFTTNFEYPINNNIENSDYLLKDDDIVLDNTFINIFNKFSIPIQENTSNDNIINTYSTYNNESNDKLDNKDSSCLNTKPLKNKSKHQSISLIELKSYTTFPELVEIYDTTSKNPIFNLEIKTSKNLIPIPKHWLNKKRYLHLKRGIESTTYTLPEYINSIGISKLRDPDSIDNRILKVKGKDKVNPKINKLDLDYNSLYDAFFVYQVKPKMSLFGEMYYEGKEIEEKMKIYKPGRLSNELKTALGMNLLSNDQPPFLENMKKFGGPLSYPNLKIYGVNSNENEYKDKLWEDVCVSNERKIYVFNKKLNEDIKEYQWGVINKYDNEKIYESEEEDEIEIDSYDLNINKTIINNEKTNENKKNRKNKQLLSSNLIDIDYNNFIKVSEFTQLDILNEKTNVEIENLKNNKNDAIEKGKESKKDPFLNMKIKI